MNKKPIISVGMPAFNAEKFISEALDSVLGQTFKDFELIVIDDNSSDNTWQIIQTYSSYDQRIKPLKNNVNLGIAGNRNLVVKHALGKYLAWQDADDISVPNRLALQYSYLENNKDVGIVGGNILPFDNNGAETLRRYPTDDAVIRRKIFRFSPIAQPAAMVRKTVFSEVGLYDLNYPPAEDLDMTFRIGEKYKLANLDEEIIRYRLDQNSATNTKLRTIEVNTLKIRFKNMMGQKYRYGLVDILFNFAHFLSIWFVPSSLKMAIFRFFRDG